MGTKAVGGMCATLIISISSVFTRVTIDDLACLSENELYAAETLWRVENSSFIRDVAGVTHYRRAAGSSTGRTTVKFPEHLLSRNRFAGT
jgi:hypothetical protein